jgi:hypothetical protein
MSICVYVILNDINLPNNEILTYNGKNYDITYHRGNVNTVNENSIVVTGKFTLADLESEITGIKHIKRKNHFLAYTFIAVISFFIGRHSN